MGVKLVSVIFIIVIFAGMQTVQAAVRIYTFTDTTNNKAYYNDSSQLPSQPSPEPFGNGTEFLSGQYTSIQANDNSYATTDSVGVGANEYGLSQHNFKFRIDVDPTNISLINVTYGGYFTATNNDSNKVEIKTDTGNESMANLTRTDANYTRSITSNFANYLDSENYLHVRAYVIAHNEGLNLITLATDYIEVLVVYNTTPRLINVTDSVASLPVNGVVNFSAFWNDTENSNVMLLIANNTDFTNCNYNTNTSCLCNSTASTAGAGSCLYTVKSTDPLNFTWYARVCDSNTLCSAVNVTYNFSGITNPSSSNKAESGTNDDRPPLTFVTGTEADIGEYGQINSSDDTRWAFSSGLQKYEWQKFRFKINESPTSINSLFVYHEGSASKTVEGRALYVWNVSGSKWLEVGNDDNAGTSDSILNITYTDLTTNLSNLINITDSTLYLLSESKGKGIAPTIRTDFVYINVTIGGSFIIDQYPSVSLVSPTNGASVENETATQFRCDTTDDIGLKNVSLWGSWNGWHLDQSATISGTSNSTTLSVPLATGIYTWNCQVFDTANQSAFASSNYTVEIVKRYKLRVFLHINNTSNKVYIPVTGVGEVDSNSLGSGTVYTNQTYNYLVSYANNKIQGLVANVKASRLFVKNSSTTHTFMIEQNVSDERIFLVLSRGDYKIIDNRIRYIVDGTFLQNIKPTFGFGLGILYPIKILLNYTSIDIQGNLILQKGRHKIELEYNDSVSGRPTIIFTRGT